MWRQIYVWLNHDTCHITGDVMLPAWIFCRSESTVSVWHDLGWVHGMESDGFHKRLFMKEQVASGFCRPPDERWPMTGVFTGGLNLCDFWMLVNHIQVCYSETWYNYVVMQVLSIHQTSHTFKDLKIHKNYLAHIPWCIQSAWLSLFALECLQAGHGPCMIEDKVRELC